MRVCAVGVHENQHPSWAFVNLLHLKGHTVSCSIIIGSDRRQPFVSLCSRIVSLCSGYMNPTQHIDTVSIPTTTLTSYHNRGCVCAVDTTVISGPLSCSFFLILKIHLVVNGVVHLAISAEGKT